MYIGFRYRGRRVVVVKDVSMSIVTITPKGQVMIPAQLRKEFGIKPGRKVSIEAEGDHLIIRPLPEDPVKALYGVLQRVGDPGREE